MSLCEHCEKEKTNEKLTDPYLGLFSKKPESFCCPNCLEKLRLSFSHHILHVYVEKEDEPKTLGESLADFLSKFAGSWIFISIFFIFIFSWMAFNIYAKLDPYPFILLNLMLSCLAALQAPVIMMSQNRKEQKDRLRSQMDYSVDFQSLEYLKKIDQDLDLLLHNHTRKKNE